MPETDVSSACNLIHLVTVIVQLTSLRPPEVLAVFESTYSLTTDDCLSCVC